MARRTKAQKQADRIKAEAESRDWRLRVRRLAIEKLRWVKVACGDLPTEVKDQRLHEIEIKQRQVKAAMWRSIPDAARTAGTGKDRHKVDKDADRWTSLHRLGDHSDKLVQRVRDRRHPPYQFIPKENVKQYGPFDIELDDLDWILGGGDDLDTTIQKLSARQERMTQRIVYRPDGSIASGPPTPPPAPRAPISPPSRPTPPPIPSMSIDRAEEFEIPFGKHRGETIGYLLGDRETIGYLQWLCAKAEIKSPKFAEALQVVYQHYEGEIDSRTPPEGVVVRYKPASPPAKPSPPTAPSLFVGEDDIPF